MSLLDVEDEDKDEKSLTESENSECKMWQYTTNEIEQLQKGKNQTLRPEIPGMGRAVREPYDHIIWTIIQILYDMNYWMYF